jgi:hypothetical protein
LFFLRLAKITVTTCWWYQAHKNTTIEMTSINPTSENCIAFFPVSKNQNQTNCLVLLGDIQFLENFGASLNMISATAG